MAKQLVPVGEGLGLVLEQSLLERLKIGPDTPLDVRFSADGQAIEIRPAETATDHEQRVLESADRMMTIHDEVFRKLAQ